MPNSVKTHLQCRNTVCILCSKKCSSELTDFLKEKVMQHVTSAACGFEDARVLHGICENCQILLRKADSGKVVSFPTMHKFTSIAVKSEIRGQTCDCLIFQIGCLMPFEMHPLESARPPNSQRSSKRCSDCLIVVGKDCHIAAPKLHSGKACTNWSTTTKNLVNISKAVVNAKEASPHGTIRLAQTKGERPLPLTPSSS